MQHQKEASQQRFGGPRLIGLIGFEGATVVTEKIPETRANEVSASSEKLRRETRVSLTRSTPTGRRIQVHGCDDCRGLGHGRHMVSIVVVARRGTDISNVFIGSVSTLYPKTNI